MYNRPSGSLPSGSVTMAGRVFSSGAEAAKFAISMSTKDAGQALPVFSPVLQRAPSSLASSAADLVFSSAADPNSAPPQFERRLSISLARSTAADAGQPYSLFLSPVSQRASSSLASPAVDSVSTGEQAVTCHHGILCHLGYYAPRDDFLSTCQCPVAARASQLNCGVLRS